MKPSPPLSFLINGGSSKTLILNEPWGDVITECSRDVFQRERCEWVMLFLLHTVTHGERSGCFISREGVGGFIPFFYIGICSSTLNKCERYAIFPAHLCYCQNLQEQLARGKVNCEVEYWSHSPQIRELERPCTLHIYIFINTHKNLSRFICICTVIEARMMTKVKRIYIVVCCTQIPKWKK